MLQIRMTGVSAGPGGPGPTSAEDGDERDVKRAGSAVLGGRFRVEHGEDHDRYCD